MFRVFIFCAVFVGLLSPAAALDLAGTVERLQGTAFATGTSGFSRPLQVDSTILVGDRVATSSNSRLRIRMNDGAVLTLGVNSELTIETYSQDDVLGQAILNIVEGTFLAISGSIAKLGAERFLIATPTATLGVRGTEVWGEQLGDRLAVVMLSGDGVHVTTAYGSVDLATPESGVDLVPGEAPPVPQTWGPNRVAAARAAVSFD